MGDCTSWSDDEPRRVGSSWDDVASDSSSAPDTAASRFEAQLRSYEKDKLACRLKLCCSLQLLASSSYAFATPVRGGGRP